MPIHVVAETCRRLSSRTIIVIMIGLGVAVRAAWNALRPTYGAAGEAMNVAVAFANGRGIADAYGPGTGPTAHFYPFTPGLGGMVYGLLGVRTISSEIVLACWSIGLSLATYLVVLHTFARLQTPTRTRLCALAFACLAPVYISQEAVDFRLWDGALTAFLMALLFNRLVVADADPGLPAGTVAIGASAAALLVINPPAGLAGAAAAALLAWRRFRTRQTAAMTAAAAAVLMMMLVPWIIRNEVVFGAFVPSRSNAGLELSIGMDPASLDAPDRLKRFMDRLREVHPVYPGNHAALAAAGGEVAYSKMLLRHTKDWMAQHPGTTIQLLLLHLRQQFAPEPWQFAVFGQAALSPTLRSVLATVVGVVGIAGIAFAVTRGRAGWIYLLILIAGLSAATLPFQPMKRYTYLYYPFLLFAAADLIGYLINLVRGRRWRT